MLTICFQSNTYLFSPSFVLGSSKDFSDILPFQNIGTGGSCDHSNGQNCAAVSTDLLPWKLHALQTYYVAIKATDTVGMFVLAWSEKYQHSVTKASTGIVYDIDIDSEVTVKFSTSKLDYFCFFNVSFYSLTDFCQRTICICLYPHTTHSD